MTPLLIDRELDQARADGPARTLIIPPCPELLTRLQDAMAHDDPDWDEVTSIANADVAMAASLVRAANSPLYARNTQVHSVPEAMSLLGLQQCATLLTQFLTAKALPLNHPALEHFWEGSTRRAVAMGFIARQLYSVPADLAHTCGLFCDVGIPILLQGLRGYPGTLAEARARSDRSFTDTEQAAHRTDHSIVGALVARAWRLPEALKLAIRLHHEGEAVSDRGIDSTVRNLIALTVVADHAVDEYEQRPASNDWAKRGAACLQHLQIGESELLHWHDTLHERLSQVH
jgi:HD-like signal output (HDOD) protein